MWTATTSHDNAVGCSAFIGYAISILHVSIVGILLCTLNRYVAIVYPLRYNALLTPARTAMLIATCWAYAVACGAVAAVQIASTWRTPTACIGDMLIARWYTCFIVAEYVAMFVLMVYCYAVIAKIAWQHTRRDRTTASSADRLDMTAFQAKLKMSKTILTVVGSSCLLLSPHVLHLSLIRFFSPQRLLVLRSIRLASLIANSLMNPIIYFYKYKDFRLAVRQLTGCWQTSSVTPVEAMHEC
ncbi:PREDICTED: melanocortin receptor 5-like [Priapulus caudatus]|uniref:Melanocortin receptor 5-like n=1 Tax=Priapulus caudatus TaxID=37621 RepID=A0ABM1EZC0_PRICU|nr:PREDICTED: melanocortin receptor 5-like [Priapulus caudatus]